MKISVIGLGFVGLTLAAVNAKKGFDTIGIDINLKKLEKNKNGLSDFYEPKLEKLLKDAINKKKIIFTNDFNEILKTNITFITVGTPTTSNGKINLRYIENVISSLSKQLNFKRVTKHPEIEKLIKK